MISSEFGRRGRPFRSWPHALGVSTDQLLGVAPAPERILPKTARLMKRLRRIERLPPADQRAVLKMLDAPLETRGVA